ncbi:MAG: hypothetical protein C0391_02315 [Anaerolinea sp.]|nr:hypothetical protein [Anaerolinea sp.]
MSRLLRAIQRIRSSFRRRENDARIRAIGRAIGANSVIDPQQQPVIFFNASTRLGGLSLNAGFSLLTAWGLRLQGIPVVHFVCNAGMSRCVLGTNRDDLSQQPPCAKCIEHSKAEYNGAQAVWFSYLLDEKLRQAMADLSIEKLEELSFADLPLGKLVMPALRWELRRHHLKDDKATRSLYREFILSAWNVAQNFTRLLDQVKPQAVVVFNGQFFPEATARYIARQRGIRTVAHEVGMLPFTAFFTEGEATAYPIDIPEGATLTDAQNQRLDDYLEKRFQGNFKMAGIQFWQGMKPLDAELLEKMAGFTQTVPVFTNVIFDTSQPHSNVVFPDMFTWLDHVSQLAKRHPETLFVIRAHPDELRPGTAKQSRETVRDWVKHSGALLLPNILYIDALEYVSSYELIQKSKFVMVYNSSIGLEAAIMGAPVLSAGRSRYTRYPTVFFPQSIPTCMEKAEELLCTESIEVPPEFVVNARKFLYYQLYKTALSFDEFLEESQRPGLVLMKKFSLDKLSPDQSETMKVILGGLTADQPFLLGDK